jgi:competence protein ComEC
MHFIVSFVTGIFFFYAFQYFPYTTGFFGVISSAFLFMRRKPLLVLMVVFGAAYAFLRYEPPCEIGSIKDTTAIRCIFETYPVKTEQGSLRQTARIGLAVNETTGDSIHDLIGREVVIFADREFALGRDYGLVVRFLKSRQRLNPGTHVIDTLYARLSEVRDEGTGNPTVYTTVQEWRHRIHTFIAGNFKKDSGALIASMTIGQDTALSERLRGAFNVTGLAHILSISGTHFGLFSVFLFGIFRMIIQVLPHSILQRGTLYLTPAQAAAVLSLPFMIAYLGLSGGSIPAIRSFIMIVLFLLGLIIGRKGFWLNSLIFAALVIVLWEPGSIFSLSFQLSFLAVMFIGFTIDKADTGQEKGHKIVGFIRGTALLTLAVSAGTAPLVAYSFHYVSLISPISNFVVAPLIGFILIPLSVISAFVFLMTGFYPFTQIISMVADASVAIVQTLSEIPFADLKIPAFPPVIVLLFYSGFLFCFLNKQKRYLLLIPFIPLVFYSVFSILEKDKLSVTFLDVGQGDAAVVELPDGKTLVVDTGRTGREVASFLRYRGKKTIDYLMLSHIHPDHTGGLEYINERFHIREVWHGNRMIFPGTFASLGHRAIERGDVIEGTGYRISVLHPYPEFYTLQGNDYIAANNDSLVVRIEDKSSSFLFAGDVEDEAEEDMLQLGKWLASDILKVPHHGGRTSAYKPFLDAVNPEIAVISAERDNQFGHPHQETLDTLSNKKILRTDIDGAIKIEKTTQGYDVKTYADFQFEQAYALNREMRNMKRLFDHW